MLCCSIVFGQTFHIDNPQKKETRLVHVYQVEGSAKNTFFGPVDIDSLGNGPTLQFEDPSGRLAVILDKQGADARSFMRWARLGYDVSTQKWIMLDEYYSDKHH